MRKNLTYRERNASEKLTGWDKIIEDANRRIVKLKAALRHAQEMKETGEPWPTQSVNHDSEQQHNV